MPAMLPVFLKPSHLPDLPRTLLFSLLFASTALYPSLTSASLAAPGQSFRTRQVRAEVATSPSYSNFSAYLFPSIANTPSEGRYGHSAVYLPTNNTLLFIGGQVGDNGTTITSQVLSFDLASPFLWGSRPVSAIPNNPSPATELTSRRIASAWAASAIDSSNRTWLIGGVTESCERDPIAWTLDGAEWSVPTLTGRRPPRRRQAQAVVVPNYLSGKDDVWVFGGIADEYTCSETTSGYLGIDRWDTVGEVVESFRWASPANALKSFQPPVGDYSATASADGSRIVVVGGQTADGSLVEMGSVLVFDTATREWTSPAVTGDIPTPRMGHVAVSLDSGAILVHGGLGLDRAPVADLHLLTPPSDTSSSWTWTTLPPSALSLLSPSRAWHTATRVAGGTIVVAFGIDSNDGAPASDIFFLTVDDAGFYTWSDSYEGNAPLLSIKTKVATQQLLHAPVIENPKGHLSTIVSASATPVVAYEPVVAWSSEPPSYDWSSSVVSSSPPPTTYTSPAVDLTPSSTAALAADREARELAAIRAAAAEEKKTTSIGASVGAIAGLALVLILAGFLVRRHITKKRAANPPWPPTFDAPFVSTLHYTHAAPSRMLSLGSTVSADSGRTTVRERDVGEMGIGPDPFTDAYAVTEVGQLVDHPVTVPEAAASPLTDASVASRPYLTNIARSSSQSSLGHTNSVRSTRSTRSTNAAEIIGVAAMPSPSAFDFLRPKKEAWELFMGSNIVAAPPPAMGSEVPEMSERKGVDWQRFTTPTGERDNIPASLRPSTPRLSMSRAARRSSTPALRVVNGSQSP